MRSLARRAAEKSPPGEWTARAEAIYARRIRPALERQAKHVQELLPRAVHAAGVARFPKGEEFYRLSLKENTISTLTPEERFTEPESSSGAGEEPGPPPSGARRRPPRDVTVSRLRQIRGGSVQAVSLARNGKSFVWRALERRNTMHRAPEAQPKSRYESRRRDRRAPAGVPKARPRS